MAMLFPAESHMSSPLQSQFPTVVSFSSRLGKSISGIYRRTRSMALACGTAVLWGAAAQGAEVGYWRFETSPGFTADSSGNGHTLTIVPAAAQVTLPATGNGSTFSDPIPLTGASNNSAATFDGTTDRLTTADHAAFFDTTFTLEAFFSAPSLNTSNKSIVGQWSGTLNQRSYLFAVGTTNFLAFLFSPDGTATTVVTSTLPVAANTDYYAAVTVNMADTSTSGITFYLQNLTAGGSLLTNGQAHSGTTFLDSTTSFAIGSTNQPSSEWTGLIDEVRMSDTKLTSSELLIVPEPSSGVLLGLAAGLLGLRRRRR
jgi:hypothetical protein